MAAQVLLVLYVALAAGIGLFLLDRFRKSRNRGFLVLIAGLSIWPFVSTLLKAALRTGVDRAIAGESVRFPFSLISKGEMTAGNLMVVGSTGLALIQLAIVLLGLVLVLRETGAQPPNSQLHPTAGSLPSPGGV